MLQCIIYFIFFLRPTLYGKWTLVMAGKLWRRLIWFENESSSSFFKSQKGSIVISTLPTPFWNAHPLRESTENFEIAVLFKICTVIHKRTQSTYFKFCSRLERKKTLQKKSWKSENCWKACSKQFYRQTLPDFSSN